MDGDMFATTLTSAPSVDGSGTSIYHLYIDKDATPNYGGMVRLIDYSTTSITILDTNGNSTKKCRVSGTTSGLPAFLKLAPGIHQTLYLDIGDSVAGRGDIKQIGGGKWFVGRDSLHTAGSSGFIEDYYRQKSSRRR
jgi:hypothetical protein